MSITLLQYQDVDDYLRHDICDLFNQADMIFLGKMSIALLQCQDVDDHFRHDICDL
jgi:hypothetical protein